MKVGWEEYWEFLGSYCDLSKPNGHRLLEEYLQDRHSFMASSPTVNSLENDSVLLPESPLSVHHPKMVNSSSDDGQVGKLFTDDCEVFTEGADSMDVAQEERNSKQNDSDESDGLSDMLAGKLSLLESRAKDEVVLQNEDNNLFIIGYVGIYLFSFSVLLCLTLSVSIYKTSTHSRTSPTKLDCDVLLALGDVYPDPIEYPNINKWIDSVRHFPEEKQKRYATSEPRLLQKYYLKGI